MPPVVDPAQAPHVISMIMMMRGRGPQAANGIKEEYSKPVEVTAELTMKSGESSRLLTPVAPSECNRSDIMPTDARTMTT